MSWLKAFLVVAVGVPALLATAVGAWSQTAEDWRWAKLEALGREGHHAALLALAKEDGDSLAELRPSTARQFLVLGIAGVSAIRIEAFDRLRSAKPLSAGTLLTLDGAEAQLVSARARLGTPT